MLVKASCLAILLVVLVEVDDSLGHYHYHGHHYRHYHHYHRKFVSQYSSFSRSLSSLYRIGTGLRSTGSRLISLYRLYRRYLSNLYRSHNSDHLHYYHGDDDSEDLFDDLSPILDEDDTQNENTLDQEGDNLAEKKLSDENEELSD